MDTFKCKNELIEDKISEETYKFKDGRTASTIAWNKIQAEELKLRGYDNKDIRLLSLINNHTLPIDVLEYYLKEYIHNFVTWKKLYKSSLKKDK